MHFIAYFIGFSYQFITTTPAAWLNCVTFRKASRILTNLAIYLERTFRDGTSVYNCGVATAMVRTSSL